MNGRFEGRGAVVTGAGSGIGRAVAQRLASEGAAVLAVDVVAERLEEVVGSIQTAGGRAASLVADVADVSAPGTITDEASRELGRIDVLCNIAGVGLWKPMAATTRSEWDRVMAVNVTAPYFLTQAVVPRMAASGGGAIVNVASVHSFASWAECGVYAASKGALLALTRSLAMELIDRRIRVNAVAPGTTDTRMVRDGIDAITLEQTLREEGQTLPIGRLADASEIAAAVAFLASDDASFTVGACLLVDGGMTARL